MTFGCSAPPRSPDDAISGACLTRKVGDVPPRLPPLVSSTRRHPRHRIEDARVACEPVTAPSVRRDGPDPPPQRADGERSNRADAVGRRLVADRARLRVSTRMGERVRIAMSAMASVEAGSCDIAGVETARRRLARKDITRSRARGRAARSERGYGGGKRGSRGFARIRRIVLRGAGLRAPGRRCNNQKIWGLRDATSRAVVTPRASKGMHEPRSVVPLVLLIQLPLQFQQDDWSRPGAVRHRRHGGWLARFSGHGLCTAEPSELSFVRDGTEIAQRGVPTLVIVQRSRKRVSACCASARVSSARG